MKHVFSHGLISAKPALQGQAGCGFGWNVGIRDEVNDEADYCFTQFAVEAMRSVTTRAKQQSITQSIALAKQGNFKAGRDGRRD
jgi:hypothetical protein